MNKVFTIHTVSVEGIRKGKREKLPTGKYWISCPPKSEGLLIFTNLADNRHWIVVHNEERLGENTGAITYEFCS